MGEVAANGVTAALALAAAAGTATICCANGQRSPEPEPEPEPELEPEPEHEREPTVRELLAADEKKNPEKYKKAVPPKPLTGMERVRAKVGEEKWAAMSTKQRKMAMLAELDSGSSDSDEEEPDEGVKWARAMGYGGPDERMMRMYTGSQVLPVDRVAASDISPAEFVKKYVDRAVPVVLTGAMAEWPAFADAEKRWSIANFSRRFGDTEVIIDTAGSKQVMPIRDYLASFADCSAQLRDAAKRGEPTPPMPYLRTWFFADQLPELVEEFETPPQVADDAFRRLPPDMVPPFQWLFFGPRGTESKLHVDVWETDAVRHKTDPPLAAVPQRRA